MPASRSSQSPRPMPKPGARKKIDGSARLKALAERCRSVAEQTVVPDISTELVRIARALDDEAARVADL